MPCGRGRMFRPSDIIINAFVRRLAEDYTEAFGAGTPGHVDTIVQVARMALARIASSDALYHDLDHTVLVVQVGQEILRGRIVRDGDVTATDWVHFTCSLLCFAIGFVRGACPDDTGDTCVIDEAGGTFTMPRGATSGRLWPYFTDRSKIFVRHYFRNHPVLDAEVMAENIEYARFPPPREGNRDTTTYPGLLRAAHIIGAVADPNFMLKLKPLSLELTESGLATEFGFKDSAEFRAGYPGFFWRTLFPLIRHGAELLTYSGDGRVWLATMHAQLLAEEHRGRADLAVPAAKPAPGATRKTKR